MGGKTRIILFAGYGVLFLAPLITNQFQINLLGRFLAYGILALGIDLIWGYTGILSLGHGVYFGLGAYCMAMYLKLEAAGTRLPDFMEWSGVTHMPAFWQPFHSFLFAFLSSVLLPLLLAAVVGYLSFRSRIRNVYFSILSQALVIIVTTLLIGEQGYTGGTNGLTDFATVFGQSLSSPWTQTILYVITLLVLGLVYVLSACIVSSRLGRVLVSIRDGENRLRFLGYDPVRYKTFVYAFSGGIAGLAGALCVLQVGIISPGMMDIVPSVEMVLWVALGGRGTLYGAVIGALLMNIAKSTFSDAFPDIWLFFLGGLFVAVVAFMQDGIVGVVKRSFIFFENRFGGVARERRRLANQQHQS
ncbi:urea ABC transporter permease subunit UrtC [Fodinisporobacter ferrooxydans]|uniref:Urea ABC transporter permease subunit UrtC n=1 Tax=Fodinisporobacter ferrooxydans TaxID=2901836 RepID=A0ABY4CLZ0_9BACL|nr:urea ABC transporter permease subunit UrtC [Alicyclobacillaceae bacterium MYW30-H2]